ncbi:MAG: RIP metalloprotease RseP [Bacteroidetes bacterium]|nr:RIP metalloprotease RseP [Bacteroidota bacterium]
MEILIKIGQLLLSLSILVVLHEAGHFTFAKIFKTRVEKFYMFFNPWFSLVKKKIGETEYGIGWLPLGGYVKIAGMIDESMDKEQMKKPPQPWEFRSKPAWQRFFIMFGGVFVNFLLAFFIYSMILFTWGEEYLPVENVKYGVVCDSAAQSIGLKNGDKILTLDNNKVKKFSSIVPNILLDDVKTIQVNRNGKILNIEVPESLIPILLKDNNFISLRFPFIIGEVAKISAAKTAGLIKGDRIVGLNHKNVEYADEFTKELKKYKNKQVVVSVIRGIDTLDFTANISESGMLGISADISKVFELKKVNYTFIQAIPAGVNKSYKMGASYLKQFKILFKPETEAYKSVGGFIAIGNIFPGQWNWLSFWSLTAFLSIMLAIINILPIPALDGGHILFLVYEIITRRKPSDKFLEYAQMVGMLILFALLIFANGNDIIKLFN